MDRWTTSTGSRIRLTAIWRKADWFWRHLRKTTLATWFVESKIRWFRSPESLRIRSNSTFIVSFVLFCFLGGRSSLVSFGNLKDQKPWLSFFFIYWLLLCLFSLPVRLCWMSSSLIIVRRRRRRGRSITDPPEVGIALGSNINGDDIKEGDDLYIECHIRANPSFHKLQWTHNVSSRLWYNSPLAFPPLSLELKLKPSSQPDPLDYYFQVWPARSVERGCRMDVQQIVRLFLSGLCKITKRWWGKEKRPIGQAVIIKRSSRRSYCCCLVCWPMGRLV